LSQHNVQLLTGINNLYVSVKRRCN